MRRTVLVRYSVGVENDDAESHAFLIAHELIEQHGDDVARFRQATIDAVMGSHDLGAIVGMVGHS